MNILYLFFILISLTKSENIPSENIICNNLVLINGENKNDYEEQDLVLHNGCSIIISGLTDPITLKSVELGKPSDEDGDGDAQSETIYDGRIMISTDSKVIIKTFKSGSILNYGQLTIKGTPESTEKVLGTRQVFSHDGTLTINNNVHFHKLTVTSLLVFNGVEGNENTIQVIDIDHFILSSDVSITTKTYLNIQRLGTDAAENKYITFTYLKPVIQKVESDIYFKLEGDTLGFGIIETFDDNRFDDVLKCKASDINIFKAYQDYYQHFICYLNGVNLPVTLIIDDNLQLLSTDISGNKFEFVSIENVNGKKLTGNTGLSIRITSTSVTGTFTLEDFNYIYLTSIVPNGDDTIIVLKNVKSEVIIYESTINTIKGEGSYLKVYNADDKTSIELEGIQSTENQQDSEKTTYISTNVKSIITTQSIVISVSSFSGSIQASGFNEKYVSVDLRLTTFNIESSITLGNNAKVIVNNYEELLNSNKDGLVVTSNGDNTNLQINVQTTDIPYDEILFGTKQSKSCIYGKSYEEDLFECEDYTVTELSDGFNINVNGDTLYKFDIDELLIDINELTFTNFEFLRPITIKPKSDEKITIHFNIKEGHKQNFGEKVTFEKVSVVFDYEFIPTETEKLFSINLIDSQVLLSKTFKFETIEIDDKSFITVGNTDSNTGKDESKLECNNIKYHFDDSSSSNIDPNKTPEEQKQNIGLIRNVENNQFIVHKTVSYTGAEENEEGKYNILRVITFSDLSRPYKGAVTKGFNLVCAKRALIFGNEEDFDCASIGLQTKTCYLDWSKADKTEGENRYIFDINKRESYLGNSDNGCPCKKVTNGDEKCHLVVDRREEYDENEKLQDIIVFKSDSIDALGFDLIEVIEPVDVEFSVNNLDCDQIITKGDIIFKDQSLNSDEDNDNKASGRNRIGMIDCTNSIGESNVQLISEVSLSISQAIKSTKDVDFHINTKTVTIQNELFEPASDNTHINLHLGSSGISFLTGANEIENLHVIKHNHEEKSKITIGREASLKVNGKIYYDNSVGRELKDSGYQDAIISAESFNNFIFPGFILPNQNTKREEGQDQGQEEGEQESTSFVEMPDECSPFVQYSETENSDDYYDAMLTDHSILGCNYKYLILCGLSRKSQDKSKEYGYNCADTTVCTIKYTSGVTTIDANDQHSYSEPIGLCPCSQEKHDGMYLSGCSTIIPTSTDSSQQIEITHFGGSFDSLRIERSCKLSVEKRLTVDDLKVKGKVVFEESETPLESIELVAEAFATYGSIQSKIDFYMPTTLKQFTTSSTVSLSFFKQNMVSLYSIKPKSTVLFYYEKINYNDLLNDKGEIVYPIVSIDDQLDLTECQFSFSTKFPITIIGEYNVAKTTLLRESAETECFAVGACDVEKESLLKTFNDLPVFDLKDNSLEFKSKNFVVLPMSLPEYYIAILSNVLKVHFDTLSSGVHTDEFRSMIYYKVEEPIRDDLQCTFTSEEIIDGNDNGNSMKLMSMEGTWDNNECPCLGRYCTIDITNLDTSFLLQESNITDLKKLTIESSGLELKGGNLQVDELELKQPLTKFTVDTIKGRIETLKFPGVDNADMIFENFGEKNIEIGNIEWGTTNDKDLHLRSFQIRNISLPTYEYTFREKVIIDNLIVDKTEGNLSTFKLISRVSETNEFGNLQIKDSRLYINSGKWNYKSKEVKVEMTNNEQFPIVISPGTTVSFKDTKFIIHTPKKLEAPIYLLRFTAGSDFLNTNKPDFDIITSPLEISTDLKQTTRQLKGDKQGYVLKEVCNIYLAIVPENYEAETCPQDPCETGEAKPAQKEEEGVDKSLIIILVVVCVLIVVVLILFVIFIIIAKKFLLRRKNLKVFDDESNVFYNSETSSEGSSEGSSSEETSSGESSGSGSGSGESSTINSGSSSQETSEEESGSGSGESSLEGSGESESEPKESRADADTTSETEGSGSGSPVSSVSGSDESD